MLAVDLSIFIPGLLLLGATLVLGINNLFFYVQYRERIILCYCLYLFAITAYISTFLTISYNSFERFHPAQYVKESMNILTINAYCYFIYEALNEWHRRYNIFFRILQVIMLIGLAYSCFFLVAGLFQWQSWMITHFFPIFMRLVFMIAALLGVRLFFGLLKGPFLNLVKWGAVTYLFFAVLIMASLFTPGQLLFGVDQMQLTFLGTFIEITIFSMAMAYKVKMILARTAEMRNRISQDLHDEVGATLSGVTLMSELASQHLRSNRAADSQTIIERITGESREMAEKMNDIVWAINPGNDSLEKVLNKINVYGRNICSSRNILFHFQGSAEATEKHLNMQLRNNIYLISKEAINNAVKYSAACNIRFTFTEKKGGYSVKIEDDGKGFDTALNTSGNGLYNMKARAVDMDARLNVHSAEGKGTSIELSF